MTVQGHPRIKAIAPIRICDIGGWTDTWFAGHGAILNIAVYPYVEVQVQQSRQPSRGSVAVHLENYGQAYYLDLRNITFGAHPLIDASIDIVGLAQNAGFEVNVYSQAPPGASTGTSAAVTVALIGALGALGRRHFTPYEIARLAHRVETEKLHLQCGVQDQLSSAFGGINYIEVTGFPHASVSPVILPNRTWWELESRLSLVYVGSPHSSSVIHGKVIADLGADAREDPRLRRLRELAHDAKGALLAGDFEHFGRVMNENTGVQRRLHSDLVCAQFERVIAIAQAHGALGCKVNGAGGDGGSLAILGNGDMVAKRKMEGALLAEGFTPIPIYLSRFGVRVWE